MNEREIDNELRNSIAKTEDEIADFCFDKEPSDDDDDGSDRSHEELTGWDGRPLSLLEHANANPNSHIDRPFAHDAIQGYEHDLQVRDNQIAHLKSQVQHLHVLADPGRQAREAQAYEDRVSQIISDPDAVIREVDGMYHREAGRQIDNVETTMGAAHERYGEEFEAAYRDLTSSNPADPVARATVQRITHSKDPGEALMQWHHGRDAGRSSGPFWNPGSRGRSGGGGRSARSGRDDGGGSNGDGNRDTERGIADSVWDDVTSGGSRGHRSRGGSEDDDIVDYAFG